VSALVAEPNVDLMADAVSTPVGIDRLTPHSQPPPGQVDSLLHGPLRSPVPMTRATALTAVFAVPPCVTSDPFRQQIAQTDNAGL
jgi:hypothetical protein